MTDFTRRTQITARYAMGDVMRLHDETCPCGSPMRRVTILGREFDLIRPRSLTGGHTVLAPDHLTGVLAGVDPSIQDYRISYDAAGPGTIHVTLDTSVERSITPAIDNALRTHLAKVGASADVQITFEALKAPFDSKLRRITNISETSGTLPRASHQRPTG